LIGISNYATLTYSYSTGLVTGNEILGGLVGDDTGSQVTSSFWDTETSGQDSNDWGAGEGKTTTEMKRYNTYSYELWDFQGESNNGNDDDWGINSSENNGYPFLSWQGYLHSIPVSAPVVTTQAVSNVSAISATGNGNITYLGTSLPTEHGVCWNIVGAPTTGDNNTVEGSTTTTGSFTSLMTGLADETIYFVRAYATNSAGISYGEQVTFSTGVLILPPVALEESDISTTSFVVNWETSIGATKYYLDIGKDNSFTNYLSGYQNKEINDENAISYTVSSAIPGTDYYYRLRAYDGTTSENSNTIFVESVNQEPIISGVPADRVNEDVAYSFVPTAYDYDSEDNLIFSIVNTPSWASFNTGTGALTGTPSSSDAGIYTDIVITVTDDGTPNLSSSLPIFSITVANILPEPEGSGTEVDPYQIATLTHLQWLSENNSFWDKFFLQISDIDASATSGWNAGEGFSAIGNNIYHFSGVYNGNGYIIDGLTINRPLQDDQGLFGYTNSSIIKNIGLTNISVIAGYDIGGLVGYNKATTISNCFTTGSVVGSGRVGGFVGQNYQGSTIQNCYANTSVIGTSSVGGLVGYNQTQTLISNSYAIGLISGEGTGGVIGNNLGYTGGTCFWDIETTGQVTSDGGTGKTTAEMKEYSTFFDAGWDLMVETDNGTDDFWGTNSTENGGYPFLSWEGYEHIYPNHAPTISGTPATSVNETVAYTFTPNAEDADDDSFTFSISNIPNWASFNVLTGEILGIPSLTSAGVYPNIIITVIDDRDNSLTNSLAPFTITVNDVDQNIVVTELVPAEGSLVIDETETINFSITANDPDGNDLVYSWKLDTEEVSTTPTYDFTTDFASAGSYTVTLDVNDGFGSKRTVKSMDRNSISYSWDITVNNVVQLATVLTGEVTNVSTNTATGAGDISSDGGDTVTERGVCWSSSTEPLISDNNTIVSGTVGSFNANITGLDAGSSYFVKAYAINSAGTAYGNEVMFTTKTDAPIALEETYTATTSFVANWESSIGATKYFVDVSLDISFSSFLTGFENREVVGNTTVSRFVNGITPGVKYYYRVRSYNGLTSVNSNTITVEAADQVIIVNSLTPEPGNLEINEGEIINFAIDATDPDGNPLEYSWKLDNAQKSSLATYDFMTDFTSAGNYVVTLDVTDNYSPTKGRNSIDYTWNVTVLDIAPTPAGSGTELDPYRIANLDHLLWVSENLSSWNKYFIQTADIDASATSGWNGGEGWLPIGNYTDKFTGFYDGDEYTISGITIARSNSSNQGFLGSINGAEIKNLSLINLSISISLSTTNNGGLSGYSSGSNISNCSTTGSIFGSVATGGLIGKSSGDIIDNCYSTISVNGSSNYTGGLIGESILNTVITSSYASSIVTGKSYVGGLVGKASDTNIHNSYSDNIVNGNNYVGGVVGYAYSSDITNCFSSVTVTASVPPGPGGSSDMTGGLAGWSRNSAVVNCYAIGSVTGVDRTGGLIGYNQTGTVTNSFWDTETTGQLTSSAGTGKTTLEMKEQDTYTLWDFQLDENGSDDDWGINPSENSGYPFLSWQNYTHFVPEDQEIVVTNLTYATNNAGTWTADDQVISETESLNFSITASDPDGNPLVYSWKLDGTEVSATSAYDFTTDYTSAGEYILTLEVTDNFGVSKSSKSSKDSKISQSRNTLNFVWNISVTNVNRAPTISGIPTTSVDENSAYSFTPTAEDIDNDALIFSIDNKPSWAIFNTSTGVLSGTPSLSNSGSYAGIVITVTDFGIPNLSASLDAFTITVNDIDQNIIVTEILPSPGAVTIAENETINFSIDAIDPDGNILVYEWKLDDEIVSTDASYDFITDYSSAGDYTISLEVTDNFGAKSREISMGRKYRNGSKNRNTLNYSWTVTVTNVNQAPTISGIPSVSVDENTLYSFTPTAEDSDDDDLIFTITNLPSWATFNSVNGLLSGTPSYLEAGVYPDISITVTDDGTPNLSASLSVFTITVNDVTASPAGIGTEADPYQISILEHLLWIRENSSSWDKYFIQTANIDASATSEWNSGAGWYPIGNSSINFTGVYDGDGYSISGITINRSTTNSQGFFGYASGANLSNIGLENVNIYGKSSTGGLVAENMDTTIVTNCFVSGFVRGSGNVGGLVGVNSDNSVINNSFSTGTVYGNISVGGLVGTNSSTGSINNSYSSSFVLKAGTGYYVAGFVGSNISSSSITNSYSTGVVSGSNVKGFVGSKAADSPVVDCFWDMETSNQYSSAGGTGKTTAEMKDFFTFFDTNWDFLVETTNGTDNHWGINSSENDGYPFLAWQSYEHSFNSAPIITSFLPEELTVNVTSDPQQFRVFAADNENDELTYSWFIDDVLQADSTEFTFTNTFMAGNYEVKGKVYDGEFADSTVWSIVSSSSIDGNMPKITSLSQNYPNPFNPSTTINYSLEQGYNGNVAIVIYNEAGKVVQTLVNKSLREGNYSVKFNGNRFASGIYYYGINTENFTKIKKMILIK